MTEQELEGVYQVSQVQYKVHTGEHSHNNQLVKWAKAWTAAVTLQGPHRISSVMLVEHIDGPDDGGCQIHDGGEQGVKDRETGGTDGLAGIALTNALNDDHAG